MIADPRQIHNVAAAKLPAPSVATILGTMNKRQQELFDSRPAPWELDDAAETTVARVVFARGPAEPFDYSVPRALRGKVLPGCRVNVPLGRGNRPVIGYCVDVETRMVAAQSLKPVKSLLDERPLSACALAGVAGAGLVRRLFSAPRPFLSSPLRLGIEYGAH